MLSGLENQRRIGLDGAMTDWKAWGKQVAAARSAKQLSQQEAAVRAGMDRQTFSNYERGRVTRPTMETVRKIAHAVGMEMPEQTRVVREDIVEAPEITAYFTKHPEHEDFRAETVSLLHAHNGHVKPHVVRALVRALVDAAEDESA